MLSGNLLHMIKTIMTIHTLVNPAFSFFKKTISITLLSLCMPLFADSSDAAKNSHHYAEISNMLIDGSFSEKQQAISLIANWPNAGAIAALEALMNGNLLYDLRDRSLIASTEAVLMTVTPMGLTPYQGSPNYTDRVRINNRIRSDSRKILASLQLISDRREVRASAISEMLRQLDTQDLERIAIARAQESDDRIATQMDIALRIGILVNGESDTETLISAIEWLSHHLEPAAYNAITRVYKTHEDSEVTQAAKRAIKRIESKKNLFKNIETLFFGLSLGSVLVLAAIGLAITFGVMGVINMAHGELIMIGAYTTFVIQQLMPNNISLSIIVAIPTAFLVTAMVGIAMERLVIRHLYGRPLETLLATFGISLILQQAVRTIFSPLNQSVSTPDWMSGMLHINTALSLSWNRIYIILFCLFTFFILLMIMKRSALGLQVRAVSQNRTMARAMGVRSERVDILTFALGSGIAGIAGVALSLITNVGPNLGQSYIIDSFIVVVFGGVGNLYGTLVAGMSLGVLNKFMEPWAGAVLAKILLLVFIILFIQKRPKGLFPQRGRAVEN